MHLAEGIIERNTSEQWILGPERVVVSLHEQQRHAQHPVQVAVGITERNTSELWILGPERVVVSLQIFRLAAMI